MHFLLNFNIQFQLLKSIGAFIAINEEIRNKVFKYTKIQVTKSIKIENCISLYFSINTFLMCMKLF